MNEHLLFFERNNIVRLNVNFTSCFWSFHYNVTNFIHYEVEEANQYILIQFFIRKSIERWFNAVNSIDSIPILILLDCNFNIYFMLVRIRNTLRFYLFVKVFSTNRRKKRNQLCAFSFRCSAIEAIYKFISAYVEMQMHQQTTSNKTLAIQLSEDFFFFSIFTFLCFSLFGFDMYNKVINFIWPGKLHSISFYLFSYKILFLTY